MLYIMYYVTEHTSYKTEVPPWNTDTPAGTPNNSKARHCYQFSDNCFLRKLDGIRTGAASNWQNGQGGPCHTSQSWSHCTKLQRSLERGFQFQEWLRALPQEVGTPQNIGGSKIMTNVDHRDRVKTFLKKFTLYVVYSEILVYRNTSTT